MNPTVVSVRRLTHLAVLALLLVAAPLAAEVVNRILATIDGDPVTLYELQQYAHVNVRARQTGADQASLLDALITERIIQKEVSRAGVIVRDEDVDEYIEAIKERNRIDDAQLRAALVEQGVTWEEYRTQVRNDLQKVQLINREIRGKVNVTPEEVQRYYEAHRDQYGTAGGLALSHIVLRLPEEASPAQVDAVMQRANDLHAQLEHGANFADLARQYSEDAAAASGGVLGTFKKGEMMEAFEAQVASLQPGQYSQPFRTKIGVHIVRVDGITSASEQPLDTLAAEIKERLYSAALEERYNHWLREDLRQQHHVEILPE